MNVMEWNNPHALYWPSVSCVHGQMFPLPLEILEEIFLNLPRNQVVLTCRLVCSRWKVVADSESLWKERCRREGLHLRDGSRIPEDWRLFYFLCKKRRNLIKNPKGDRKNLPSLLFRHVWLPVDQELNFFSSKLFWINYFIFLQAKWRTGWYRRMVVMGGNWRNQWFLIQIRQSWRTLWPPTGNYAPGSMIVSTSFV